MLDPSAVPDVDQNEILARFVLFSAHVRSDNSIRQDAFVPHPRTDLSLTRHREATEDELWNEARRVAASRGRTLYGRADVSVAAFTAEGLRAVADPELPYNPNHANITDWPEEKSAQKLKAIQIASRSEYRKAP